jgi:glycosyltransferase involved in cell wall biosynthesis
VSSSLRILHCFRAPVGGLFRHARDLALEQARRGHAVGIICAEAGDRLTEDRLRGLTGHLTLGVHRLALGRVPGTSDIHAIREVRRLAQALQANVVHGHGAKGGLVARAVRVGVVGGPRVFYTPHGGSLHFNRQSASGFVVLAVERWLERSTSGLLFECQYAADRYADVVGTPRAPSRVVPNGVRLEEFAPRELSAEATDLLFVGELRALKGVDVLLRAIAALRQSGEAVTATLVGDGPDAATYAAMVRDLNLADHVRLVGARPMADALPRGRILVVPSRAESLPYVVLEAAAAGVPVIASRVGGIGEICGESGTRLVAPGDVAAWVEAIRAVLAQPETA